MQDKNLTGKNALVTGGNRGIGAALVKELAAQGANVIFCSSSVNSQAQEYADKISRDYKVRCKYVTCDLKVEADIDKMIEVAKEEFKKIDILMNNAGLATCMFDIENMNMPAFMDSMKVNLTAPFLLCKKVVPMMKENKWGRIVNFSSSTSMKTEPNLGGYIIPKSGVHTLTKVLAKEVGGEGITVNCIVPGCVDTDMYNNGIKQYADALGQKAEDLSRGFLTQKHIISDIISPKTVADFALYLCSDSGKSLTGGLFPVDNGYTC